MGSAHGRAEFDTPATRPIGRHHPEEYEMKTLSRSAAWLASLCLSIAGAGCSGSSDDVGAAGTWEIDRAATAENLQQRAAQNDPIAALMRDAMIEMVDAMDWTVTLAPGGAAALRLDEGGRAYDTSGSWSLEGSRLRLEYYDLRDRPVALQGTVGRAQITLEAPDPDAPQIVLTRSSRAALAVEEAPPVPPLGPLRAACPPALSAPQRQSGPVDDIVQLRVGMPYDDIVAILECRDDIRVIQSAPLFSIQDNFGVPTRQLVRAANGIPCSEREARGDRCSTLGRFEPLRDITQEYVVAFTGLPGDEIARAVWRRSVYSEQDGQAVSVIAEALGAKYGPPQLQATGNHSRINGVRSGATSMIWAYNQDGSPAPPPAGEFSTAAINWETCVNGPQPTFAARHSWNSGCHLTIRAEILPQETNGLLARELNVVVMNQRDFFHAGRQFEAALRSTSDERLRQQSARPEL
jgi:hypothetical protein